MLPMTETSFAFGPDGGLIGTWTQPGSSVGLVPTLGLVLFNAGVVHRVGPHRLNVKIARQAARMGVPALRFDLHGQGDSARASNSLGYVEQVLADLGSAMQELGSRSGVERFAILGFCSGAPTALRSALVDPRVASVLLYDGFTYPTLGSRVRRYLMRIRQHGVAHAVGGWLRRSVAQALGQSRRLLRALRRGNRGAGANAGSSPGSFGRRELVEALNALVTRGVHVTVLHSGDGFDHVNYVAQFRDATRRYGLSEKVVTDFLPQINHVATSLESQRIFCDYVVERWVRQSLPPTRQEHTTADPGPEPAGSPTATTPREEAGHARASA